MNDNITVSRELLRQILVRLELGGPEWERDNMIKALRAALEQPGVEPEAWYDGRKFYATSSAAHMDCADIKALRPLYEAPQPQQPAPVQEPEKLDPLTQLQVAYVMGLRDAQPRKAVKLTHLSLGALDEIYRESFGLIDSRLVGDQIMFARAIEQAVRAQFGE